MLYNTIKVDASLKFEIRGTTNAGMHIKEGFTAARDPKQAFFTFLLYS